MRKKIDAEGRGFLFGVLFAAWFLHDGHGEDTLAEELLLGADSIERLQRLAQQHEYRFRRGFWACMKRKRGRDAQSDHECESWNSGGVCSICRRTIDVFSPSQGAVSGEVFAVDRVDPDRAGR